MNRKWLPTLADLIDRLSIHQLKEVFLSEHKDKYAKEMKDIALDVSGIVDENNIQLTGEIVRAIVVIAQINTHIWYNEAKARRGESQDLELLKLSHGLNGIRNKAMNYLLNLVNLTDRQDWKIDCLGEDFKDWEISLGEPDQN